MAKQEQFTQVITVLDKLGLKHQFDDSNETLITGVNLEAGVLPITISIVSDYWVCLTTWGLFENPVNDEPALAKFIRLLLAENNFTKLGKFYINDKQFIEFAVDIRLADLSLELLNEAVNLMAFVVENRLPELAEPYVKYLFKK